MRIAWPGGPSTGHLTMELEQPSEALWFKSTQTVDKAQQNGYIALHHRQKRLHFDSTSFFQILAYSKFVAILQFHSALCVL